MNLDDVLKKLSFKKNLDRPKKKARRLSLPSEVTGMSLQILTLLSLLYLEDQRLLLNKEDFLQLEDNTLSLSHQEAELHASLVVAQSCLELDIASYNNLKSKYFSVLSRSEEVAK